MPKRPNRDQLRKLIATNVRYLVRCETEKSFRSLEGILELTLWLSNTRTSTHERLGKGIIALSTILDLHVLESTAHGAVFYRRMYDGYTFERADKFADDALALAGVEVEARNKEMDPDSFEQVEAA